MSKQSNFPPVMSVGFDFSRQRQRELGLGVGQDPAAFHRVTGHVEGFLTAARMLGLEVGPERMPRAGKDMAPVHLR